MNYTLKNISQALIEALEGKKESEQKKIIRRFAGIVAKRYGFAKLEASFKEVESIYFKKHGINKIFVRSASALSEKTKNEIKNAAGGKSVIEQVVVPNFIAGMQIFINEEILIDATARRKLQNLFKK